MTWTGYFCISFLGTLEYDIKLIHEQAKYTVPVLCTLYIVQVRGVLDNVLQYIVPGTTGSSRPTAGPYRQMSILTQYMHIQYIAPVVKRRNLTTCYSTIVLEYCKFACRSTTVRFSSTGVLQYFVQYYSTVNSECVDGQTLNLVLLGFLSVLFKANSAAEHYFQYNSILNCDVLTG